MGIKGLEELEKEFYRLQNLRIDLAKKASIANMSNKMINGGTPWDTGALTRSAVASTSGDEVGYIEEYAPHVEYGHRTRGNGYVAGQYFLKKIYEEEKPNYIKELIVAVEGKNNV